MKFLFECVGCYGTEPPLEVSSKSSAAALEETCSLVSLSGPAEEAFSGSDRRLGRQSRHSSRLGPGDWKPSLHAISEDIMVTPVKAKAAVQVARVASARRGGRRFAIPTAAVHSRGQGDSYGRDPMPMVVPAFSPTAFLF